MTIDRRTLLFGTAAAGAAASLPFRALANAGERRLVAAPTTAQLLPVPAAPTPVWGYAGSAPGSEIRVKAGERVRRTLVNDLPQPTAVHWHGIRLRNAMDGAAGLTQAPVQPGDTFEYDFVAPDPGTYWYHSHDRSWEQNARGLHGPLIIEEPEPWRGADREEVLLLDDWFLSPDGSIHEASFGELSDWSHAGRIGNTFTVNGSPEPDIVVRANERVRLRLINAANARTMWLRLDDHPVTLIALDGHPVTPRAVEGGLIEIAPAQRADVVVDFTAESETRAPLMSYLGAEDWVPVAHFAYTKEKPFPRRSDAVAGLPDWMKHDLDSDNAQKVRLVMDGGAMGSMRSAKVEGRVRSFRELVGLRRVWAFNGVAGDMDEPLFRTERGRTVELTMQNASRWPHAMHMHGHHFQVLDFDGRPARYKDWRDTVLLAPQETVKVVFDASNPGKWLLHCHMLEHQAGGMITWFNVA